MKQFILPLLVSAFSLNCFGQTPTVGTIFNTEDSYDGYTLFAPMSYETTYLIDNCGQVVNSWESAHRPGLSAYLLEDGSLLRTKNLNNSTFGAGGSAGGIEHFDWNGSLTWEFEISSTTECHHHDIEYLPNGNILMIVWELKSDAEAIQAGRNPDNLGSNFWPDKIIEVEPSGLNSGTIVWEWHAWDHLIQEHDATKDNYGVVADHPELIDINSTTNSNSDWLHINSVDYSPEFDQIVMSIHNTSELWIIDHSTSTLEATGHTGGNSGNGGDILYRWGNPQIYDRGTPQNKKFYAQHDARWITEGVDAGKLMVFNNGQNRSPGVSYSSVDVIDPPVDVNGNYTQPTSEQAFLPNELFWSYVADPTTSFYSSNISGAKRLPNENTLICEGSSGHLFEVKPDGEMVWKYQTPVGTNGPVDQGTNLTNGNSIFRCTRYGADHAGFVGHDLTPGDVVELNSTVSCELYNNPTGIKEASEDALPQIIQNHAAGYITIIELKKGSLLTVYDSYGRTLVQKTTAAETVSIPMTFWPSGIYHVTVRTQNMFVSRKVLRL